MGRHQAFLLLGSNLNHPSANLTRAIVLLSREVAIERTSSLYISAPWGIKNQPEFYNQVVEISTGVMPEQLLTITQSIEAKMGRERKEKWGPRLIDIDILFYDHEVISSDALTIPHPHIPERRFTLLPMAEISPDFRHPTLQKSITQLLDDCSDELEVKKLYNL